MHALEYLDTKAGKKDITQSLEEEYTPLEEEVLKSYDEKLNHVGMSI